MEQSSSINPPRGSGTDVVVGRRLADRTDHGARR